MKLNNSTMTTTPKQQQVYISNFNVYLDTQTQ